MRIPGHNPWTWWPDRDCEYVSFRWVEAPLKSVRFSGRREKKRLKSNIPPLNKLDVDFQVRVTPDWSRCPALIPVMEPSFNQILRVGNWKLKYLNLNLCWERKDHQRRCLHQDPQLRETLTPVTPTFTWTWPSLPPWHLHPFRELGYPVLVISIN